MMKKLPGWKLGARKDRKTGKEFFYFDTHFDHIGKQARGESVASSVGERIAGFRARIADRKAKEGKEYLSFYHVEGGNYEVLE